MGKKIQCIGRYSMEGQTLGKGNFARVELAHHSITGVKVAIKIIDRSKLKEDYQKDHLHREARILGQLRHPNIIRLYETLKATTLHCLVLELASGGELQTFIRCHKDGRLPEDKSRPYIRQLISALHYLHERGVAHRDLKMENIMLDEKQKHVKLVDFGLSITFTKDELMKTHCGSPEYAAPELFAAKDRYGPEIDVWSLGIVMYAMMIGRLPFTTPYTDHYRRQKLVQQMEKGLTEAHSLEMSILSQDCQDMLRKVIEPSPEQRIPLLDMEVHVWVTNNTKLPFFPFQAFPRDRTMRHQGSPSLRQQNLQDSVCSTDEDETMAELSAKLEMKKEQVEQKVGESKSDEVSAMYNMMLDAKRREQGLYDFDHTSKPMERRDGRAKRRAKSADDKKSRSKDGACTVPPALVLPAPQVSVESAPQSGGDLNAEPETRMTSFDFLALCSTPSWLGPEKRRSRRRARSPNPTPQHNRNTDGMSVRSQMRQDYLERQSMEASQAAAGKGEHHSPNTQHAHRHGDGSRAPHSAPPEGVQSPGLLSPDHATCSLPVPDTDGANARLRRGSSLKLSRKRNRSFGPRPKKRTSFQRSGSVDTPVQDTDSGNVGQLQGAKSDTLATASPSTLSVAAASLAVAFGGRTSNVLTLQVPGSQPADRTVQHGSVSADNLSKPASFNTADFASQPAAPSATEGELEGGRGPLTSVEVHVPHSAKSCSSPSKSVTRTRPSGVKVVRDLAVPKDTNRLELPTLPGVAPDPSGSWSTESLMGDSEVNLLPSPDQPDGVSAGTNPLVQPLDLLDCNQRPVFHQQVPPHALSHKKGRVAGQQEGKQTTTAMQAGLPKATALSGASQHNVLDSISGQRNDASSNLEPSLRASTVHGLLGATGISGNFKHDVDDQELITENEVEVTTEDDDAVFVADSEKAQQVMSTLPKNRALHPELPGRAEVEQNTALTAAGSGSAPRSLDSPPAVAGMLRKNKRGSAGSSSQASSSGSRSQKRGSVPLQGGKLKASPSPLSWMVLHSPLARIESFHSDDFELYNSSENEPADHGSAASTSPGSANTPTHPIPCFAYKLNMARKKLPKLMKGTADHNADGVASKKASNGGDLGKCNAASPLLDPSATDPLLTSGSDTEQLPDDPADKTGASKAKVHPEDKECEKKLLKADSKPPVCNNVITQQPDRQAQQNTLPVLSIRSMLVDKEQGLLNSIDKMPPHVPCLVLDPMKKVSSKTTPWNNLAHFWKRKKQSTRCNNNNNDCASSPMLPANHNGCSPGSPVTKMDSLQASHLGRPVLTNSTDRTMDMSGDMGNCKPRNYGPNTENSLAEGPEFQTSFPAPPASPDTGLGTRVFDFTLLNDSPKGRPCLLSWRPCGDCATSDLSSEDESECNPEPVVTLDLKPLANNSVGDRSRSFQTSYECSGT